MYHRRRPLFFPVLLIVLGALLLLQNLDLAPELHEIIEDWWPLILILLGLDMLIRRGQGPAGASSDAHAPGQDPGTHDPTD